MLNMQILDSNHGRTSVWLDISIKMLSFVVCGILISLRIPIEPFTTLVNVSMKQTS